MSKIIELVRHAGKPAPDLKSFTASLCCLPGGIPFAPWTNPRAGVFSSSHWCYVFPVSFQISSCQDHVSLDSVLVSLISLFLLNASPGILTFIIISPKDEYLLCPQKWVSKQINSPICQMIIVHIPTRAANTCIFRMYMSEEGISTASSELWSSQWP